MKEWQSINQVNDELGMKDKPYISVDEVDGTCWSSDGIACPYCQHFQRDIFEIPGAYTEDGGETNCGSCGKLFSLSTYISYAWTTRKMEQQPSRESDNDQ